MLDRVIDNRMSALEEEQAQGKPAKSLFHMRASKCADEKI